MQTAGVLPAVSTWRWPALVPAIGSGANDGERPAARRLLANQIAVSGPIEELETLRERFRHGLDDEYALHIATVAFHPI